MKIDREKLGRALKVLRKQYGLTQQDVAEEIGVTKNFVSLIETGERGVSVDTLSELARLYKMPLPCLISLGYEVSKRSPWHGVLSSLNAAILDLAELEAVEA